MKTLRYIFKQIRNEWKSNFLILLELFLVLIALFYIVDFLRIQYETYRQPVGFDIDHVYYLRFEQIPSRSADFDTSTVVSERFADDFLTILKRIESDPRVESVGYSAGNTFPYMFRNRFTNFNAIEEPYHAYIRTVDPSFFRVFKLSAADGGSWEVLEKALIENKIVVTQTVAEAYEAKGIPLLNESIWVTDQGNPDSVSLRVGAVCVPQRYHEFSNADYAYYIHLGGERVLRDLSPDVISMLNVYVRVKPSSDRADFIQRFQEDLSSQFRLGNLYLADMTPMSFYREQTLRSWLDQVRIYVACAVFLVLNVLFGIIGTFWLRTQRRVPEIGLHMAMGASREKIFRHVFLEAFALLAIVFLPVAWICAHLAYLDLWVGTSLPLTTLNRFGVDLIISVLLLILMIALGILIPALKAARLQPTEALREE